MVAAKSGPGGEGWKKTEGEGRSWHLMHSQPKPLFLGPRVLCSGAGSQPQGETGSWVQGQGWGVEGGRGGLGGGEGRIREKPGEGGRDGESERERRGGRSRCGGYEYGYMHSGRQENMLFLFTLFFKDLFISDIEQELALEASRGEAKGEGEEQTPL